MDRYVDQKIVNTLCDDILQRLDEMWRFEDPEFTYDDYIELHDRVWAIKYLLPADVVRTVRCHECKHYKNGYCYEVISSDNCEHPKLVDVDWYCAEGKRRKDDE